MPNDHPHNDFLQKCKTVDFSKHSENKEYNKQVLRQKLAGIQHDTQRGVITMKTITPRKARKSISVATIVAAVLILSSITVYATDFYKVIKNVIFGDNASYVMVEYPDSYPVPPELQGKLFDAEGSLLDTLGQNTAMYNATGKEVYIFHDGEGKFTVMTVDDYNANRSQIKYVDFYDLQEGASYFITGVLSPSYLPSGYTFEKVQYIADSKDHIMQNGIGSKYMNLFYSDGANSIRVTLRYMDEETAYEDIGTSDVQEMTISGHDALVGENSVTVLVGKVEYVLYTNDTVNVDELIKIAESLN